MKILSKSFFGKCVSQSVIFLSKHSSYTFIDKGLFSFAYGAALIENNLGMGKSLRHTLIQTTLAQYFHIDSHSIKCLKCFSIFFQKFS